MPELEFHSRPVAMAESLDGVRAGQGDALVQRVLHAAAHGCAGDYALLRGGATQWVLGIKPYFRLLVDDAGCPHVDDAAAPRDALPPLAADAPLAALQSVTDAVRFRQPHPLVGWLGFLSYDMARFIEPAAFGGPRRFPEIDGTWPLLCFTLFRHYLVMDELIGAVTAYDLAAAPQGLFDWEHLVHTASSAHRGEAPPPLVEVRQPAAAFQAKVQRVKEYIAAGDIYQANLAQRWIVRTSARPHDIFTRLCNLSRAPHAACLRFTHAGRQRHIVSASPELFLDVQADADGHRIAISKPIKGTRPRDRDDPVRDATLRDELLASPKDRAELTMIVDLLRNDLGRVSEFGTVHVEHPRALEAHPTVWHTVATIRSKLRADAGLADILAALCPGGSITGAPKIRAMQIIEELEGFDRELYCGNIGILGDRGRSLLLNIAIRTILFDGDRAHVYAGGGIVADSDPQHEYEETLHKARAMLGALGIDAFEQA